MENKPLSAELDLRWGTRIPYNQEVLINRQSFGMIKDISVSGCFIETKKMFGLGQEVNLRFILISSQQSAIETHARVVNIRPGTGIGVKFFYDSDKTAQKIKQFVDSIVSISPNRLF